MTTTGDERRSPVSIVFFGLFLCLSGCFHSEMMGKHRTIVVENQTQRPVTSVLLRTDQNVVVFDAILPSGRRERQDYAPIAEHPRLEWRDEAGAWHAQEIKPPAGFLPPEGTMKVEITEEGVRTGELVRQEKK